MVEGDNEEIIGLDLDFFTAVIILCLQLSSRRSRTGGDILSCSAGRNDGPGRLDGAGRDDGRAAGHLRPRTAAAFN